MNEALVFDLLRGCNAFDLDFWIREFIKASDLTSDSREVKEGSVFIALKGERFDGHDFIKGLLSKHQCLFVVSEEFLEKNPTFKEDPKFLFVKDTKDFTRKLAPVFFDNPSKKMRVIGITGTNGKTTTSYFLEALYKNMGKKVGVIGTVNIRIGEELLPNTHTTPDIISLQRILWQMKKKNVDVVIMEVSSHALVLDRVHGVHFDSVIWTSFTQDHMDFHKTMEAYFKAKLLIFNCLHQSEKQNKNAIVFNEMKEISEIKSYCEQLNFQMSTYGSLTSYPTLGGEVMSLKSLGMRIKIRDKDKDEEVFFNRVGVFNLYNSLASLLEFRIYSGFSALSFQSYYDVLNETLVPGRLEKVPIPLEALVVVDYAHTPDALENVLKTLKEIPHRRLICVFGCGGDRDAKKRPLMGAIAENYADLAVVTSDNPRRENPKEIIEMILLGMKKDKRLIEVDRHEAIFLALKQLEKDDILLIAGKGHEDYQIIGEEKIHFDDREVVKSFFQS